jgi:hypothetical protein
VAAIILSSTSERNFRSTAFEKLNLCIRSFSMSNAEDLSISDLFNVNGMVFVITGGGSGLGEAMALALDKNGASKVFILGRREASLRKVADKAVSITRQCFNTTNAVIGQRIHYPRGR